jgi:hypothetical protein
MGLELNTHMRKYMCAQERVGIRRNNFELPLCVGGRLEIENTCVELCNFTQGMVVIEHTYGELYMWGSA